MRVNSFEELYGQYRSIQHQETDWASVFLPFDTSSQRSRCRLLIRIIARRLGDGYEDCYLHTVKRGLLVYRINRDDPANTGVIKKCKAQQKAFEQNGLIVDMLWLCKEGILKNEDLLSKSNIPPHSYKAYRFYFLQFGKILFDETIKTGYDFIYLRHPFFDPLLVSSLRKIKRSIPKIKIFLEINTYPYDAEPKRLLHKMSLKMDQYYRKNAKEYIDRIVDYGQRESIWGIPTISVRNGIDVGKIPVSNSQPKEGALRLIAVGNWSYWHGLDRVLEGMKVYINGGGNDVCLKIIGEGSAFEEMSHFIEKHQLGKYIQLLPSKKGPDLENLFDDADLGIGTLGLHRKKVILDSSLKHRSYCARGIPFVFSGVDPDFQEGLKFVKHFEAENTPIPIGEIKSFFENLKKEGMKYRQEMRTYAEEQLTWKKKLSKVFEEI